MRFPNAGRINQNSFEGNSTAPGAPVQSNAQRMESGRGGSSTGAPRTGRGSSLLDALRPGLGASSSGVTGVSAGAPYDMETVTLVELGFKQLSEQLYSQYKNDPDSARLSDHNVRFVSLCRAYETLTDEGQQIFDKEIAPRSIRYSAVVEAVRAKYRNERRQAAERHSNSPARAGAAGGVLAGQQNNPGSAAAAAQEARNKAIAARAAAQAERRAKVMHDFQASLSSQAAGNTASSSSARFQAPPVAPFQIQRPPQAALQSSPGYASPSHHSSYFSTSCANITPYLKIGATTGAVIGIGVGGYLVSKHFTAA